MKIEEQNNEIIVRFPAKRDRINPYMPGEDVGQFPNFIGLVTKDKWGLARRIDMDYKNKPDQVGQIVVDCTHLDKEKFIEQCQNAHIVVDNWEAREKLLKELDKRFKDEGRQM